MSARRIRAIARRLEAAYGPRGWWPTVRRGGSEPVYHPGNPYRRKRDGEVFEIAVGAVLGQNTAWSNARLAIAGLRAAALFSAGAILAARRPVLERAIRSSGYYRAKAQKLKALASFLAQTPVRVMRATPTAALRARLLAVHGVGPETADDILCYALDRPVAVADAYARRILSRSGAVPLRAGYESVRAAIEAALPSEPASLNEFHAQLVELAKRHCRTVPECRGCPVRPVCDRVGLP